MYSCILSTITMGLLTGIFGFVLGVLMQQDASYRGIHKTMSSDPYIYLSRQQIYNALQLLGQSQGSSNYNFQSRLNTLTMFFTYSLDDDNLASTGNDHVAKIMKFGFPGLDDIHVFKSFVLSYDRHNRVAHWVCEHITGGYMGLSEDQDILPRNPNEFHMDMSIPIIFRSSPKDYLNSDWVPGQLASPYNYKYNSISYYDTFVMSNIVPLSRSLKATIWPRLASYVRKLANEYGSVHIYTGPVYKPQRITFNNWAIRHQVIGTNMVSVPTHLFKIIIAKCADPDIQPLIEGYLVPNGEIEKNVELESFLTDIENIEQLSGLKFFTDVQ